MTVTAERRSRRTAPASTRSSTATQVAVAAAVQATPTAPVIAAARAKRPARIAVAATTRLSATTRPSVATRMGATRLGAIRLSAAAGGETNATAGERPDIGEAVLDALESTERIRRPSSGPAVVLRMPPPLDPPVDTSPLEPIGMDQLPLEWPFDPSATARPAHPRRPRAGAHTNPPSGSYSAAQRFVSLCVEILNGYRPPSQLRPMADPHRFGDISDQLLRRTVRVHMAPGQAARHGHLVRARRLLLSEPTPGIAEAAAVLEHGTSTWAMAIRLEHTTRPGLGVRGWVCTVLQVL